MPDQKLSYRDQKIVCLMVAMDLWTKQAIADVFGISRRTVLEYSKKWVYKKET